MHGAATLARDVRVQVRQNLQVVVVADDPIEAGMLALDVVQGGIAAQAVRDHDAARQQIEDISRTRPEAAIVVVAAHRDIEQSEALWHATHELTPRFGFVAVVLRSQRDAADRRLQQLGWSGVAVRPVNAEEMAALVTTAVRIQRPPSDAHVKTGSLADESLLELLQSLVDRVPRPGLGKSAIVELESHGRRATVAIVDGELTHAECDGESGRHVLERICCWRQGAYRIEPGGLPPTPTLTGSSLGLIAVAQEYARRIEEARHNLPYTDCVCSVRWERVRPLPVVAEAMFRRIASGMVLAAALPGEGDDELEAYAALETRIKRGAVLPQIESAPPAVPGGAATDDDNAHSARVQSISAPFRPSSAFPAVPMTLVDAPQMPARRRSHPTTHLYRVGADARISDVSVEGEVPRDLPGLPTHPSADPNRPPAMPRRLSTSAALPGDLQGGEPGGGHRAMSTGWFGIAVGQGVVDVVPAAENVPLRSVGARASQVVAPVGSRTTQGFHQTGGASTAARTSQGLAPAGQGSVRPYSWMPTARLEAEPIEEPSEPSVITKRPLRKLPWFAAAALLAVAAAVVLWPVSTPHAENAEVGLSPGQRAYRRAVSLIDAGQEGEARATLQSLVQLQDFQAEALIHLAVLEAQAGDFDAARTHLDQYIAHPDALHRSRARRLHQHLFGPPAGAQAAQATPAPGGS
ncbi:MAG: DUF4388 domain-containing protein [Myxococcales bacterium]|nr:DUF4388 domain-containing protein [Myxococcales bacterium]